MVLAVAGILGASLVTLNSVSRVVGTNLVLRQLLWGVAGLVVLVVLSRIRLDLYQRAAPVLYAISIAALMSVRAFGVVRGGSRAWFASACVPRVESTCRKSRHNSAAVAT